MKKVSKRVDFVDIARGIAILLMIASHTLQTGIKRSIIFSFHMPLFIIVSGYFYKDKSLKQELKDSLFNLLIPTTIILFIVFNVKNINTLGVFNSLIESLKMITVCWSHQSKIVYGFADVGVLWFIYMLVIIKLLFIITKKISKNDDLLLFCFIIIESFIGYIIGINGYWLPWSIDVSFACMLFYYFGYILKKYDLLNKIMSNIKILVVLFIIWIIGIKYNWIEIAMRSYPNGLWSYVTAICGSIIVLKFSTIVCKMKNCISNFIIWCGRNSLYILMAHYIERSFIKYNYYLSNPSIYKIVTISLKCLISIVIAFTLVKIKEKLSQKRFKRKLIMI